MADVNHNHLAPFFPKPTRIDNMTLGADEAIAWLADVIDNGLTALYSQPDEFWASISKRMVDAQLSGISNKIKHLSRVVGVEDEEYIIDLISEIYLIAKSIKKIDQFPFESQLSFLNSGGYNITKKQLENAEKIQDEWLILGVIKGEEEKIKFRRTWIQGVRSKFMGLILDFAWGKQEFMQNWQAGRAFQGDVRVYPGAYKIRVLVENHNYTPQIFDSFASYPNIESFLKAYTVALARQPVLQRFPVCLKEVSIQMKNQTLTMVDNQLDALPLLEDDMTKWSLFSASAGHKIHIFAEWDGRTIHPISTISQGRFIKIKK